MWRMEKVPGHGLWTANRPAGRPARRRNISWSCHSNTPRSFFENRSLVVFQSRHGHYMASGAHSLFRKSIRGWFYLEETRALGALKPTVSGIGFYLHKDLGAAEVGILSTQRMSRGRDPDFIYATNSARPGSDFYLHKRFIRPGLIRI